MLKKLAISVLKATMEKETGNEHKIFLRKEIGSYLK